MEIIEVPYWVVDSVSVVVVEDITQHAVRVVVLVTVGEYSVDIKTVVDVDVAQQVVLVSIWQQAV